MSGKVIGEVDLIADIDGALVPAKAKALGELAGKLAAQGFDQTFNERMRAFGVGLRARMRQLGTDSGNDFGRSLEAAIAPTFIKIGRALDIVARASQGAFERSNLQLELMGANGATANRSLRELTATVTRAGDEAERTSPRFARLGAVVERVRGFFNRAAGGSGGGAGGGGIGGFTSKLRDANGESAKFFSQWKGLPHGLRQVILIVAAIAAAGQEIAVLGSAAGGGLVILGAAAVNLIGILGILALAFKGVSGPLEDLPVGARDAVRALQVLGNKLAGLQDAVQVLFFQKLQGGIEALTTNVFPRISAGFTTIADSLGNAVAGLLDRLASAGAQEKVSAIFGGMNENVAPLIRAIGNIGSAIAGLLIAAKPFTHDFFLTLQDMTDRFDRFVDSTEGKNQLAEWFSNAEVILSALVSLVGRAGKVLSHLVTPESVKRTERFLGSLEKAMPFIEDLLDLLGGLDIFGLLAQVLDDVGNGLRPFLKYLTPVGEILSTITSLLLDGLGVALQFLAPLFIPLQVAFGIINYLLQKAVTFIQPYIDALGELGGVFDGTGDTILAGIQPALDRLFDSFTDLLPSPKEMARIIREEVIPWLENFATDTLPKVISAIQFFFDGVTLASRALNDLIRLAAPLKSWADSVQVALNIALAGFSGLKWMLDAIVAAIKFINGTPVTARVPTGHGVGGPGTNTFAPLRSDSAVERGASNFAADIIDGSTTDARRSITVESGAIQVIGVEDPDQAASAVLDRILADIGS